MPVNFFPPQAHELLPIKGVRLGIAAAGINKSRRNDLLVIYLETEASISGVFTQNRFCAAPVIVAKEHLAQEKSLIRALVINTGNANAATGEQGIKDARETCHELAYLLKCEPNQILPFSTGVIIEPLPLKRLLAGLPCCIADLHENNWFRAAQAIMTTDTVPKAISKQVKLSDKTITITGIAKGAGMIHPNMATMLSFIATDAAISQDILNGMMRDICDRSFNCITVDGDTSTNDSFILIATGRSDMGKVSSCSQPGYSLIKEAISEVATKLAQAIVRDGEGATKFISIFVEQGTTVAECKKVAYAIARSPLVKTAFFASDPNLGRILAAIGNADIDGLNVKKIKLYLGDVLIAEQGKRSLIYSEAQGRQVMQQPEITIRVQLNRGACTATVWTCDFSYDYVKINAEYRS